MTRSPYLRTCLFMLGFAALLQDARAGDPCAGQGNAQLAIVGNVPAAVGTVFDVRVSGLASAPFTLAFDGGSGPVEVPGIGTLCLDLGPQLRILFDGVRTGSPLLGTDGTFTTSLKVPSRPALAGRTFYMQAVVQDPSAPMGFAISNLLTIRLLPSLVEPFTTTDFRDDSQLSAIWEGNGRLEGITKSTPRVQEYQANFSQFNLAHPLVETGNPFTTGCRLHMLFMPEDLAALPGESIIGMEWSPRSDFTFASTYENVAVRLGHLAQNRPWLSQQFSTNFDQHDNGVPTTVFEGQYDLANNLNAPWEAWPEFQSSFEYDNDTPVVFEYDMPAGGDTYQLFRNTSTSFSPNRRVFGDGGATIAGFGNENTTYSTRFVLVQDRGVARSLWYSTGTSSPDYSAPYVNIGNLPEGSAVELEFEGARDINNDGIPDPGSQSGFRSDIDEIDGLPLIRFRCSLRAIDGEDVAIVRAIVIPFEATGS